MKTRVISAGMAAGLSLLGGTVYANHHIIQIEQVIGGVDGDTSAQAIQVRMRSAGQQFMQFGRVRAWDAAGANPIVITPMNTNVANGSAGRRVLIASPNFRNYIAAGVVPDFVMTTMIPASYFNAGRITFEDDGGTIWWSLAFGGAGYTGSNTGDITNDADGNFGPPWPGALPSTSKQALLFLNSTTAPSTNNAADYALTGGGAVFTNNAAAAGTVISESASTEYWDINGTTAGAGGATPSGAWNGLSGNFNRDSTGGAGGFLHGVTSALDTVVFAAGNDATGNYTVTLTGTRAAGSVVVEQGHVTFSGGILATGVLDVVSGSNISVMSPVNGGTSGSLTKNGDGIVFLAGANTYTNGNTVNAGTLISTTGFKGGGPMTIANNAIVRVAESAPSTYDPPTTYPSGSNSLGSKVSSLTIAPSGQLDLGNSDLAIDHGGTSPLDDVRDMLTSGYNGGSWDGAGIISNTLAANNILALDPSVFGLGYAENIDLPSPYSTGANSFFGIDVDDTTTLIKFTWVGDLNLDGFVDFQDLSVFNTNYDNGASSGRYWFEGDFNYDGRIDFQDLSLFNTNYDPSKPSLPEPAAAALLALPLLCRRFRRAQNI